MLATVAAALIQQFPGIADWRIQGDGERASALPPYLGLVLAAMNAPLDRPVCFILPRRGETARIVPFLHAFHALVAAHDAKKPIDPAAPFRKGDRVRVNPDRKVYLFDGLSDDYGGCIWLKTGTERRALPRNMLERLEITDLPVLGGLKGTWDKAPATPLDQLVRRPLFGSTTGVGELLLLDGRAEFELFCKSTALFNSTLNESPPSLDSLLPAVDLASFQAARKATKPLPSGLVFTHDAAALAEHGLHAPPRSQLVVVNGVSRLRGHIQAYDQLVSAQKVVLIAETSETDVIVTLADRGCQFWPLPDADLVSPTLELAGTFAMIGQAAANRMQLVVRFESCTQSDLQEALDWLLLVDGLVGTGREGPATQVLAHMWHVFLAAVRQVGDRANDEARPLSVRLAELHKEIRGIRSFLSVETEDACREFLARLEASQRPEARLGENKAAALFHALDRSVSQGTSVALIASGARSLKSLESWLSRHPSLNKVELFAPNAFSGEPCFGELVFAAWPGGECMRKVAHKFAAPVITLVGYPWECNWLRQAERTLVPPAPKTVLTDAEMTAIARVTIRKEPTPRTTELATVVGNFDILAFEGRVAGARIGSASRPPQSSDTVLARYVRFAGNSYAFLTEGHRIAIATTLIDVRLGRPPRLPEVTVDGLIPGDLLVFPESGEHEFLQVVADRLLGIAEARSLRTEANLWKQALLDSGLTPDQFSRRASDHGLKRHPATVRGWFTSTSQIGPRDQDDLGLIARVTGSASLARALDRVSRAIDRVRTAHQQAGMRVRDQLIERLPQVTGDLEDDRTYVPLGDLGAAWIVRADVIEAQGEQRGRNEVNRLLQAGSLFSEID